MASTPKTEKHAGKITNHYPSTATDGSRASERARARARARAREARASETEREGAYATSVRDRATFLPFSRGGLRDSALRKTRSSSGRRASIARVSLITGARRYHQLRPTSRKRVQFGGVNPTTLPDAKCQKHMRAA